MTKSKYTISALIAILSIVSLFQLASPTVTAAPIPNGCPGGSSPVQPPPSECGSIPLGCPGSSQQGPIASPPSNCPYDSPGSLGTVNEECKVGAGEELNSGNCEIVRYLVVFTNALSAIVGIVIVIMIVVGGIQYSASRENPQSVQAAKKKITNAILALVVYMFMFAFLQWIVPGGAI